MSVTADILPPSIRDERSLALAGLVDRLDLVDMTKLLVWRFAETEATALPHLAAGFDTPLMARRPLTTAELRGRVASSTELHRLYGTPAGLRALARLVDAEVIAIEAPPGKQFAGAGPSAEELAAYRALMPELRIYRFRQHGTRGARFFAGDTLHKRFGHLSDAAVRLGRRAELVDRGRVTPLVTAELVATERQAATEQAVEVRLPGTIGQRLAAGRCLGRLFAGASDAATRIYRVITRSDVTVTDYRLALREIRPTLQPMTAYPEQVAVAGNAGHGFFLDRGPRRMFATDSRAGDRLYERLWLHDPARRPAARRAGARLWCDNGRLGQAARTAVLTVKTAGRPMPPRQRFVGFFATGVDLAAQRLLLATLDTGRPAGSRLLVTTTTRRPVLAGQAVAGSIVAGATVEAI